MSILRNLQTISVCIADNPKLSVFVGNFDFGRKEKDLRVFFEGVASGERGAPGVHDGEDWTHETGELGSGCAR
jgi:hypothetical protein